MLCCGPLQISCVQVGDMAAKALRKKDKRVRKEARESKGLDIAPSGDKVKDSNKNNAEPLDDNSVSTPPKLPLDSVVQSKLYHGVPHGHGMYKYYEADSYDPRILTTRNVAWLSQCRILGCNANTKRAYITGLGQNAPWGGFEISEPGTDPMDPYRGQFRAYPCYLEDGSDVEDPTYPFHEACYAMLAKRLGF